LGYRQGLRLLEDLEEKNARQQEHGQAGQAAKDRHSPGLQSASRLVSSAAAGARRSRGHDQQIRHLLDFLPGRHALAHDKVGRLERALAGHLLQIGPVYGATGLAVAQVVPLVGRRGHRTDQAGNGHQGAVRRRVGDL
jgi:hypothetical protein